MKINNKCVIFHDSAPLFKGLNTLLSLATLSLSLAAQNLGATQKEYPSDPNLLVFNTPDGGYELSAIELAAMPDECKKAYLSSLEESYGAPQRGRIDRSKPVMHNSATYSYARRSSAQASIPKNNDTRIANIEFKKTEELGFVSNMIEEEQKRLGSLSDIALLNTSRSSLFEVVGAECLNGALRAGCSWSHTRYRGAALTLKNEFETQRANVGTWDTKLSCNYQTNITLYWRDYSLLRNNQATGVARSQANVNFTTAIYFQYDLARSIGHVMYQNQNGGYTNRSRKVLGYFVTDVGGGFTAGIKLRAGIDASIASFSNDIDSNRGSFTMSARPYISGSLFAEFFASCKVWKDPVGGNREPKVEWELNVKAGAEGTLRVDAGAALACWDTDHYCSEGSESYALSLDHLTASLNGKVYGKLRITNTIEIEITSPTLTMSWSGNGSFTYTLPRISGIDNFM